MQIKPYEVERHLSRQLAPIYILSGDEPLQLEEALDQIRSTARDQGFDEKIRFDASAKFDWESVQSEAQSLSLFADRRILDVRLPSGKPGDQGSKVLKAYAENPNPDNLLIVSTSKLDAATKRASWYKALDKAGVSIQFWPVDPPRLPGWIQQRARRYQLKLTEDAARLLAERVEGNLLACAQELEKLSLLHPAGVVDLEGIVKAVGDSARFSIFDCVEAALLGDTAKVVRIIQGLRDDGTEPILLAWALTREIRLLEELATQISAGADLATLSAQYRLWEKRQRQIAPALKRHSLLDLRGQIRAAAELDRSLKGALKNPVWDELIHLGTWLSGVPIRPCSAYTRS